MAYDKDLPTAPTSLILSNPQILANWAQLQAALNNEHIFAGTAAATQTGDHTQGSARCFSQATEPATRIDGSGFLSTDLGSLWVDTDDNALYILTATAPTWTPVSNEVIAILLASARTFASTLGVTGDFGVGGGNFVVAAATGNVTVAGNVTIDGSLTTGSPAILDDGSRMATSAAPTVDSHLANKKFVDDEIDDRVGTVGDAAPADYQVAGSKESITFPNGLIIKTGTILLNSGGDTSVTFGAAFPGGIVSAVVTLNTTSDLSLPLHIKSKLTTGFTIDNPNGATPNADWISIGY